MASRCRWQHCLVFVWTLAACGIPATGTASTGTTTPRVAEERILHQVAEDICPPPDDPSRIDPYERHYASNHPAYTLICYPAAGHSLTVTIRRFGGAAEALAEFESVRPPGPALEVQGFPSSGWQEHHPSFPGGRHEIRVRLLQAGPWLVRIESFDDTHYITAPDPGEVSLSVGQAIREQGFPP